MSYTPITRGQQDWDTPLNAALTSQDGRITTNESSITTLQGQMTTANSNIATLQGATASLDWQPQDHGWKAWTQDPAAAQGGATSVTQTIYFVKVPLRAAGTVSNIYVTVTTAGSGLTAGQNLVGLYTSAGTKLVESADQSTPFGSIGLKTIPISPQSLSAGFYWVAIMSNGTTPANFMRGNSQSSSALNFTELRFVNTTGNTSLPASFTPGSANTDNNARWAAIS